MAISKKQQQAEAPADALAPPQEVETAAPVAAQEQVAKSTTKPAKSTNLIHDFAVEIEHTNKAKAQKEAKRLADEVEQNYFKLGGYLKLIHSSSWFDGHPDFGSYVYNTFGFEERKARYLIDIYDALVINQIDWEDVKSVGWTKLRAIAKKLTQDNVAEWVEKANSLTMVELTKLLKDETGKGGESTQAKSTDTVTFKFGGIKPDQASSINQALAKAKGVMQSDADNVALEAICVDYLGSEAAAPNLAQLMLSAGLDACIAAFNEAFPEADLHMGSETPTEEEETA